jgi:hypothetical protein
MRMPGFTADQPLPAMRGSYRSRHLSRSPSDAVVPAIPPCRNCDYILDWCIKRNNFRAAVCADCAFADCDPNG